MTRFGLDDAQPEIRRGSSLCRWSDLVDRGQPVERALVADVGHQLAQRIEQYVARVADTYVAGSMLRWPADATISSMSTRYWSNPPASAVFHERLRVSIIGWPNP